MKLLPAHRPKTIDDLLYRSFQKETPLRDWDDKLDLGGGWVFNIDKSNCIVYPERRAASLIDEMKHYQIQYNRISARTSAMLAKYSLKHEK